MHVRLRVLGTERAPQTSINCNVKPPGNELLQPLDNVGMLLEVDSFDISLFSCESQSFGYTVDSNHSFSTLELRPSSSILPDGSKALKYINQSLQVLL